MSLNRYGKRKDANQAEIVEALRKAGVKVWILDRPCDVLTLYRGVWLPLEIKDEKGRLTPEQVAFCVENRVPIVRSAEEALMVVGVVKGII